ncbi:hypothetical protein QQF64_025147 [Cirrhinus molitorella]|uniref:Uncharacterized protein n=1 Tax=Cirrhinus molitorella TaxID=172907 RepID=A0ABR3NN79_9TELE
MQEWLPQVSVPDSLHLNSSPCLMFIGHASERVGDEKGTLHYRAGSSEDQERMSSRTTTRKTNKPDLTF